MAQKEISFTGGDPLLRINKCLDYAKLIKDEYSGHHVHLYTGSTHKKVKELGKLEGYVDEVRFHVKNEEEVYDLKSILNMDFDFGI